MMQFWLSLIIFFASHSVISRTPLRRMIVSRLGEKRYVFSYSLLSILLLAWLIYAAISAPRIPLWPWMPELYWVPNILMPVACVFFASGFLLPNPLSIMPRPDLYNSERPPMVIAVTRHPVLWGFFLWSFSHVFPNGDFPLALMFITFTFFAAAGTMLVDKKYRRELGMEQWRKLSANTGNIPFTNPAFWRGNFRLGEADFVAIAWGLGLYIALYYLHPVLFGISPAPPF